MDKAGRTSTGTATRQGFMPREETREYFLAKKMAYEGLLRRLEEEYRNKL